MPFVYERCHVKSVLRMLQICSVMERGDLQKISERTSSSFSLDTVRQLWARYFSPAISEFGMVSYKIPKLQDISGRNKKV